MNTEPQVFTGEAESSPSSSAVNPLVIRKPSITVLHEIHTTNGARKTHIPWNPGDKHCTCSYCQGDHRMHYGLNIPKDWKARNSWYVLKYWPHRYIRVVGVGPMLAKIYG